MLNLELSTIKIEAPFCARLFLRLSPTFVVPPAQSLSRPWIPGRSFSGFCHFVAGLRGSYILDPAFELNVRVKAKARDPKP